MTGTQERFFLAVFVLLPLTATVLMLWLQLPWRAAVGGTALTLLTGSWLTIYRRVRKDLPDHPLAQASYLRLGLRDWNLGVRLVVFYFRRYGLDVRSGLLVVGLAMLVLPVIIGNIEDVID